MATVGSLFINVKARTAAFSKKMKSVRATMKRMAIGFGRVARRAGQLGAILTTVLVAGVIALTKSGITAVDMLGKTASKLGINTKSLQSLQLAAKSSGVSVETFNMAMQRMVRRVSEAGRGFGEAKDALKELGLDAEVLSTLPVDEQFRRISDAMEGVGTQGDRVRLAMKLFDSEGVALVNTMQGGSAALDEFSKRAKELGLLLETDQVRAVENVATKLGFLSSVWSSFSQHLAAEFAPILSEISNRLLQFIEDSGGMGQIAEFVVKAFMYAGAAVLDVIKAIGMGWNGLKAAVLELAATIVDAMAWAANRVVQTWETSLGLVQTIWGLWQSGVDYLISGEQSYEAAMNVIGGVDRMEGGLKAKSSMGELLELTAGSLHGQAAEAGGALLESIAEGWNIGKVDSLFKDLKGKLMGEGFVAKDGALDMGIDLKSNDIKGAADALSTAVGSMKVEGDAQSRVLEDQAKTGKKSLQVQEETLKVLKTGGVALT